MLIINNNIIVMRTFSRDAKTNYYKFQSIPRNYTQEKRMKELYTLKDH